MSFISDTDTLVAFCERQANAKFITVDTEFHRDKTYWPQLCVIQIGGPDEEAAIDALADEIDLTALFDLMQKPDLIKVFHAARQDFEIFYQLTGKLPSPVSDTQISAMVCGFGDSVGYETLVSQLAGQRIDKSMRFTDWKRRPLSQKQLDYALADVTHLRVVYERLSDLLTKNGREDWVSEELAALLNPSIYKFEVKESWRRLKVRNPSPKMLAILREVAAWREEEAQTRDVPRNRILRDDALIELAIQKPRSLKDLQGMRGLHGGQTKGHIAEKILSAISRGLTLKSDQYPKVPKPRGNIPKSGPTTELLKVLLKMKCEKHSVAQKLIASSNDIDELARDDNANIPALKGWRRQIFGNDAIALKQGKIAMTVAGNSIQLVKTN
ncbi:MAG: ribonuclease D [Rhodospirillaceae bacterium]|nr:ribonuclease D [Rhodospirillaceae bacterium]